MRLIDADALKRDICKYCNDVYSDEPCEPSDCEHMRIIDNQPAIDAVEVVRCKDCKQLMLWCKPTDKVIGECFIRKMNSEDEQFCMVGADDFCSYGERKDNV